MITANSGHPRATRAKHQLLDRYLGRGNPIYIDGLAGRGRHNDGCEGSPLVALTRSLDYRHLPAMQKTGVPWDAAALPGRPIVCWRP